VEEPVHKFGRGASITPHLKPSSGITAPRPRFLEFFS
jgi:hypothetical protein